MIFLTFDTDHMDEPRMREFLSAVPIPGAATFFCTQRYPALEATPHDLCPHPFLPAGGDWDTELAHMRALFPNAKGWRAHSCVYSHILAEKLFHEGYTYASTNDMFGLPSPRPAPSPWGVWQVPIYYMDNMDFSAAQHGWTGHTPFDRKLIERAIADSEGWYVFDFHPIHLLLNSDSPQTYFAGRDRFKAGEPLERVAYPGYGTRSFYLDLLEAMRAAGLRSAPIKVPAVSADLP